MPTGFDPVPTCRYDECVIHFQGINGSTATGCQANDGDPIRTPTKVLMPRLLARIEQGHLFISFRVKTVCLRPFITVTPSASETQITLI